MTRLPLPALSFPAGRERPAWDACELLGNPPRIARRQCRRPGPLGGGVGGARVGLEVLQGAGRGGRLSAGGGDGLDGRKDGGFLYGGGTVTPKNQRPHFVRPRPVKCCPLGRPQLFKFSPNLMYQKIATALVSVLLLRGGGGPGRHATSQSQSWTLRGIGCVPAFWNVDNTPVSMLNCLWGVGGRFSPPKPVNQW